MEQWLVTSVVAAATAILVALWNVGGWGALQRRTIRQELDIAKDLLPGVERQRLEEVALERATLYVHRRTFVGPSTIRRRRLTMLTLILPVLFVMSFLMSPLSEEGIFFFSASASLVLFSGLLGYWAAHGVRVLRARSRRRRLVLARDELSARSAANETPTGPS